MNRAKSYLIQYRQQVEKIRQCYQTIDAITATLETVTLDPDGLPRASDTSDRTGRLAVQLAELSGRLEILIADAWGVRADIENVIRSVPVPEMSRLLYDRYILFKDWREIADAIGYEESYTRGRLHARSLEEVEKKIHQT